MKEIIKAFFYLAASQFTSLFVGFIRSKMIAVLIGPAGLGLYAPTRSFLNLLNDIASIGGGNGIIKLVGEYWEKEDYKKITRLYFTTSLIFGCISVLIILLCFLFSSTISLWIFNEAKYAHFIFVISFAVYFSLHFLILQSFLKGLLYVREFVLISVVGELVSVIPTVFLIYLYRDLGAVLSLLVTQVIYYAFGMLFFYRGKLKIYITRFRDNFPTREIARRFYDLSKPTFFDSVLSILVPLYIQSQIIRHLGLQSNGIYQVVVGISVIYKGFYARVFSAYGFPKISSLLKKPTEIIKVQNDIFRFALLFITPVILVFFIFRETMIILLYDRDFLLAGTILIWQLAGDYMNSFRQSLNIALLPLERISFIYLDRIIYWIGWVVFLMFFIPSMGITAVPLGFFLVTSLSAFYGYLYQRITHDYRIARENVLLIGKSLLILAFGVSASYFLEGLASNILLSLSLLVAIILWLPSPSEYLKLSQWVYKTINTYRSRIYKP